MKMKRKLLISALLLGVAGLHAQTKATAVVTLGNGGMTAKMELNNATTTATLTLTGPSDRWFALQIGNFANGAGMQEGTDVVYWNGTTLVDAVQSGIGGAPTPDTNDWTVTSNTTSGSTRTVVATRAFNTGSADDYAIAYTDANIDYAWARASTATNNLLSHGSSRGYSLNVAFADVLDTPGFTLQNLQVYPNPVIDVLTLSNSEAITEVELINMLGQVVISQKTNSNNVEVNTSQLQNGSYILKVSTAYGTASSKILK